MRKIRLFILLLLLSLFSVLGFADISTYLSERKPIVQCEKSGFYPPQAQKYYTHPQKLVVAPWRGPHNVYGIFAIPTGYSSDALFTVSIPGTPTYCGQFQDTKIVSSDVDQPHLILKGLLNTRIALKLIAQGKLNQLREEKYWRLGYVRR
ncbi:hypothetical protein VB620_00445 [Nodularia harveyana UHCC-0300]|uniref:Uncharacterized protein n=1 Tax=Nodularia harveyana UHCC-0300 TaxID=2974287 RepID=A0ABU5U8E0_9CYAN|nr:hypothetical protein [Nodularia harveyana]MEA5579806.1 hypothetical protein [Nodularia harveyana UHCC-0300]